MIVLRKLSNETDQAVGHVVIKVPVAEKFSSDAVKDALTKHISV